MNYKSKNDNSSQFLGIDSIGDVASKSLPFIDQSSNVSDNLAISGEQLVRNILAVVLFLLFFLPAGILSAQVKILVNFKPFSSISEAASQEDKVNWWDADYSDDRACTECFAAMELARFLPKCTNLTTEAISLSMVKKVPEDGDVFIIGSRYSNPLISFFNQSDSSGFSTEQSYRIRSFTENKRTITIIEGSDRVGTLYGVYNYLNDLGIQFYGLGKMGIVYPNNPSDIHKEINKIENPSFYTRGFHAFTARGTEDFFLWMARNKLNFWTDAERNIPFLKKLGIRLSCGGHNIQSKFLNPNNQYPYNNIRFTGDENMPADPYPISLLFKGDVNKNDTLSYFEAHPEWYGLHKGIRSDKINGDVGDNYCTSDTNATAELAKNLVDCLIDGDWKNADLINLWMLDNGKWCECEKCVQEGSYTDRLFDLSYVVLNKIREAREQGRLHRKVEVVTLAYHETLSPPTHPLPKDFDYENFSLTFFPIERCYVHAFADPACTEINEPLLQDYLKWTQGDGRYYKGSIFIGEYYNVSKFQSLPLLFTRIMTIDIPWYYSTGVRDFHYMHTPTRLWGTCTLTQNLFAKLLWNATANADEIKKAYFENYYPTTSEVTREFYNHLELASANFKALKHYVRTEKYSVGRQLKEIAKGKENVEIFPLDHLHYNEFHPTLNDGPDVVEMYEEVHKARKYLDKALLLCDDSLEQHRLLEDEYRFSYGEDMMEFYYHIIRTAIFHQKHKKEMARHEFQVLIPYANKLKGISDLVQVSYFDKNIVNGYDATYLTPVYEFFNRIYGDSK